MEFNKKYLEIVSHYESCLEKFGDSHLGVDWPREKDVDTRYRIMLDMIHIKEKSTKKNTLLDFGCGASHLYEYILRQDLKSAIEYSGLDLSEKFINVSKNKYPSIVYYCLDILNDNTVLPSFDYIVMNGVFTVKRGLSFEEMLAYFKKVVQKVYEKSLKGIAFNVMSKHVDWERDDLFHLPFDVLSHFLTKHVSRHFIIRCDYGLYEYTVYVYRLSN